MNRKNIIISVIWGLVTVTVSNCSSQYSSSTTKTEVQHDDTRYVDVERRDRVYPEDSHTTKTETKTEEVHDDSHHGIFGILVDIIVLPFRAVGALFTAIF